MGLKTTVVFLRWSPGVGLCVGFGRFVNLAEEMGERERERIERMGEEEQEYKEEK